MRIKRIILDTNLWISFLISKDFRDLDKLIENKKILFLFSKELLEEFISVSQRPKFHKYFSDFNIKELLRLFDEYGKMVSIKSSFNKCRDKKDNFLINLAIDGKADYLVTGDNDLLELREIGKTKIVTIKDFISTIK